MTLNEIIEEQSPRPQLKVIRGGKGPPEGPSKNWLIELQKGAIFSCKLRGTSVDLELYGVSFKHTKTTVLFNALGLGPPRAVDPGEFCKKYDLFEVIDEGGATTKEEDNDGIRTIRSPELENDANASGRQPQHEET